MGFNLKTWVTLSGGYSLLLSPALVLAAQMNPCASSYNKNAIHCAYLSDSGTKNVAKFIKVKETQAGHSPVTSIYCVGVDARPLMNIAQSQWGIHKEGDKISWQFSQCADEDCSSSRVLLDDKFTITKSGKMFSSAPKNVVEFSLDPNYGANCTAEMIHPRKGSDQHQLTSTSLQTRIDDAVAMMEAIPGAMNDTSILLGEMRTLAVNAATGTHTPLEYSTLNNLFQTLKDEVDKAQRVNTLSGYKKISNGTVNIQIGYNWYNLEQYMLEIPLPATSNDALSITYLDLLSSYSAANAVTTIDAALDVVSYSMSFR